MSRIKIYMGIPSTGDRVEVQNYFLREVQERYKDKIELVFPELCVQRIFHDFARNEIVKEFLDSDCDLLWFLDSDICPPKFVLDLVTNHLDKWQVAGAPYPIWQVPPGMSEPHVLITAYKGIIEEGSHRGIGTANIPASGTDFIDALATGCLFIKREVFSQLQEPYFEFKYDAKTRKLVEGEDLGFALKLNKLGIKFFVDYGMVCKHYKRVCLLDVNNFATTVSNQHVLDYDKEIRLQVQTAINQAMDHAYKQGLEEGRKVKVKSSALIPNSSSGLILPANY